MKLPRRIDAEIPRGPADTSGIVGTWVNTNAAGQGPARLEITDRGGAARVVTRGGNGTAPVSWDEDRRLYGGIATPSPLAWSVRRRGEGYEGLLQGNLNLGLLVLGTYKTYTDGRTGYFSREFYLRTAEAPVGAPHDDAPQDPLFGGVDEPGEVDLRPVAGSWVNTDSATRGIARIEIAAEAGRASVRVLGTGTDGFVDWGEAELGVYAAIDEAGGRTLSLLAGYAFPAMESQLQLRIVSGTLVLASFNSFEDGQPGYFTREFFYRDGRPRLGELSTR